MKTSKVGVHITNTPAGLHKGHETLIDYAKQFGDVSVRVVENPLDRSHYFLQGINKPKYKVNYDKLKSDCDKLGVEVIHPTYMQVGEAERNTRLNRTTAFVDLYKDVLLSPAYRVQAISSILATQLEPTRNYDLIVTGPELLGFFYKRIGALLDWPEYKIMPSLEKDSFGSKIGSGTNNLPFDRKRIRTAVNGARHRFQVGTNNELVNELRKQYVFRPWQWEEITVWEGGIVPGRLEVCQFSYQDETGLRLVEEVDYYA